MMNDSSKNENHEMKKEGEVQVWKQEDNADDSFEQWEPAGASGGGGGCGNEARITTSNLSSTAPSKYSNIFVAIHYRKHTQFDSATGSVIISAIDYIIKKIEQNLEMFPLYANIFNLTMMCPQEIDEYWDHKNVSSLTKPPFGNFYIAYTVSSNSATLQQRAYMPSRKCHNTRNGEDVIKIDWLISCIGLDGKIHQLIIDFGNKNLLVLKAESMAATITPDSPFQWYAWKIERSENSNVKFELNIRSADSFRNNVLMVLNNKNE